MSDHKDAIQLGAEDPSPAKRQGRVASTLATAVVLGVASVAMLMKRGGYATWYPALVALDVALAFVGVGVAGLVGGPAERGAAWAAAAGAPEGSWGDCALRAAPLVLARAVAAGACLAVGDAVVGPVLFYREEVELPVLEVLFRFLGDLPQHLVLCLAVELLVGCALARTAARR